MPHVSHIFKPTEGGLVALRISVPADKITQGSDEVFINTGAGGVIRVPNTLLADSEEPGYVVFEARVPGDVAAAIRSMCAELFRLTCTSGEDWSVDDPASGE